MGRHIGFAPNEPGQIHWNFLDVSKFKAGFVQMVTPKR